MRQQNPKRTKERQTRRDVSVEAWEDCGWRCTAHALLPGDCHGPLDAHEIIKRSLRPGSHLERDLIVGICRRHHEYVEANVDEARIAGLYWSAWELDEARAARARLVDRALRGRW